MKKQLLAIVIGLLLPCFAIAETITGPQPSAVGTAAVGQIPATQTNDNACSTCVGNYISVNEPNASATVTITNASPAVITWTAHSLVAGNVVNFTNSGGALPTGITAGTNYYVIAAGLGTNTFEISATAFGTAVNTSSAGSGTQTATSLAVLTSAGNFDAGAIQLTPGDWRIGGNVVFLNSGSTVPTLVIGWTSTSSATLPTAPNFGSEAIISATLTTGGTQLLPVGEQRISISSPTTVYLSCRETFTVGPASCGGFFWAERASR